MSDEQAVPKKGFIARIDGTKFARRHPELWKFFKALCVGAISSRPELVVYLLLCLLLTRMQVSYLPSFFFFDLITRSLEASQYLPAVQVYAFLLSTAVGQTINFVLARKVAFHANANMALSTFLKAVMVIITIGLSGIVGPGLVTLVAKIPYIKEIPILVQLLSKSASMGVSIAWVYPTDRFIVHRVKKEQVKTKIEEAA